MTVQDEESGETPGMKRFRWDKKYLYWGVTAFLVIAATILFYMLVSNLTWLHSALQRLGQILSPFIWGLVIAYLLYPLMRIYQRGIFKPIARALFKKSRKAEQRINNFSRGFAVFLAIVSLLVLLAGLIWMVGPQLYSSLENLVVSSGSYIVALDEWLAHLLTNYPEVEATISSLVGDVSSGLVAWVTNNLMPEIKGLLTNVTMNVYYVLRGIYNMVIGIIVSVYLLYSRETFAAHCKKILYSIFSLEASKKILDAVKFTNDVFMGFISGKILDSAIIGIMCYIGCLILRIEYAVLVSFIVGVTNVIPFFGPLIGMIPGTLILLTVSPLQAIIFLVFVILLQQFDGNILGPKILGGSVGINGFWVMFSIIVGAGLFGFAGMLLGVPVFVVIYTFFTNLVNRKLARSDLPFDTEQFFTIDYFDPKSGAPVYRDAKKRRRDKRRKSKEEAAKTAAPSEQTVSENVPVSDDADAPAQP